MPYSTLFRPRPADSTDDYVSSHIEKGSSLPRLPNAHSNREEDQRIVKVCYRNAIPYVPYSTGFYGARSHAHVHAHVEDALLIDLKRMNDFVLDEKHFYVEVGPGMVYSPIQEECMNHGAYVVIGGGGA